ncbi:MAG TPA: hypothetical protein VFM54_05355, partial [Micromonosporaceae bacterium]|nr:hypothetical protein [Micromonosporaceae bacterium]
RVIVVAHSMGGLVARYWLGPLGGAPYCRALVTVGTPHRGAPKALDWLVNGARLGGIAHPAATEVLRGWPGLYDLLPRYRAVWCAERDAAVYPYELDGVAPAGFVAEARRSFAMHGEIEKAFTELSQRPADQRPEVVALFARGHATLGRAVWADGELRVVKDPDPQWLPNAGWRGDGTVPAISAVPIELDEERRSWRAVPERHGPMAATPAVVEILKTFASASLAAVRGDTPDHPWLGLDLEGCVPAGEPVPVEARLYGAPAGPAAVWVRVKSLDDGNVRRQPCRMAETADGWRAVLDPLPEGRYGVAVEAVNVPGVDRVRCVDMVAAV